MQALLSGGTFPEDISSSTSCMLCNELELGAEMFAPTGETWLLQSELWASPVYVAREQEFLLPINPCKITLTLIKSPLATSSGSSLKVPSYVQLNRRPHTLLMSSAW